PAPRSRPSLTSAWTRARRGPLASVPSPFTSACAGLLLAIPGSTPAAAPRPSSVPWAVSLWRCSDQGAGQTDVQLPTDPGLLVKPSQICEAHSSLAPQV